MVKGLSYVGIDPQYAFAYSGPVLVTDSGVAMLDFTTGAGYIVAEFQISTPTDNDDDFFYKVEMNDQTIMEFTIVGPITNNQLMQIPRENNYYLPMLG